MIHDETIRRRVPVVSKAIVIDARHYRPQQRSVSPGLSCLGAIESEPGPRRVDHSGRRRPPCGPCQSQWESAQPSDTRQIHPAVSPNQVPVAVSPLDSQSSPRDRPDVRCGQVEGVDFPDQAVHNVKAARTGAGLPCPSQFSLRVDILAMVRLASATQGCERHKEVTSLHWVLGTGLEWTCVRVERRMSWLIPDAPDFVHLFRRKVDESFPDESLSDIKPLEYILRVR